MEKQLDVKTESCNGAVARRKRMGIYLAEYLKFSGKKFWNLIKELENLDIFLKLYRLPPENRVIWINPLKKYIPYPGSGRVVLPGKFQPELLVENNEKLMRRLKNLGQQRFQYYFFEGKGTDIELAEVLGIGIEEIKNVKARIESQINCIVSLSEQKKLLTGLPGNTLLEVTAELFPYKDELKIAHAYYGLRYRINEDNYEKALHQGMIRRHDVREYQELSRHMNAVNFRFTLLQKVVEAAVAEQAVFLMSEDIKDMNILSEKGLSKKLGMDPSWICRIVRDKVLIIQKKPVLLRDLFVSEMQMNKKKGKILLRHIIKRQENRLKKGVISRPYSHEEIRLQLWGEFNFKIARRTINNWMREIERNIKID